MSSSSSSSFISSFARWWVMGRKNMGDPLVTVVKLSGVLQAPIGRGPAARRILNLDRVEKWLQRAFLQQLRPAACAIAINSPGGSPVQSELIHDMIVRLKEQSGIPVYTFAEDVAASGGYWLMAAGDESFACSTSLVGSIGVVSSSFGATSAAEKLGIERRVWTAGHAKIPMDPFLPVSPEQEERLKDIMYDLHDSFIEVVKRSRGDRLNGADEELFSGRAWTGKQAVKLGLVDGVGTLRGTMRKKFGKQTRFLLCSPEPSASSLRDLFGFSLSSSERGGDAMEGTAWLSDISELRQSGLKSLLSEDAGYAVARAAVSATLDEAEERALWDRWKMQL